MLDKNLIAEFDALSPGHSGGAGASRRVALKAALGVGYAACALPVKAQGAIKTSSEGLSSGETQYVVGGFQVPAFYAAPAGKTNLPVILVVHEVFGVHEYIADVVRRLARAGYLALAPELYARQGDAGSYNELAGLMSEVVAKVPDAQVMADLDGAVGWAAGHGGNPEKVGITGFCWGGRIAWLYAEQSRNVKAGVAWYGRLAGTPSALNPAHPLDLAATIKAPVLGLYGGQDSGIPLGDVNQMKDLLAQAGAGGNAAAKASSLVVYPDAPHAFHADYRPSYRKEAAEDGFRRALAWFRTHGVA